MNKIEIWNYIFIGFCIGFIAAVLIAPHTNLINARHITENIQCVDVTIKKETKRVCETISTEENSNGTK